MTTTSSLPPPPTPPAACCSGEPVSWLRLERYHESEVDAAEKTAIEQHLAFRALVGIEVIDAVERAQKRRLPASGRTDESRHLASIERNIDGLESAVVAVEEIEIPHQHLLGERAGCIGPAGDRRRDRGNIDATR